MSDVDLELAPDLLIVEPMSHREAVAVIVNPAGTLLLMELGSHAHTTAPAGLLLSAIMVSLLLYLYSILFVQVFARVRSSFSRVEK